EPLLLGWRQAGGTLARQRTAGTVRVEAGAGVQHAHHEQFDIARGGDFTRAAEQRRAAVAVREGNQDALTGFHGWTPAGMKACCCDWDAAGAVIWTGPHSRKICALQVRQASRSRRL